MNKNNTQPVLMIDNYDSFTFNLVHYIESIGQSVVVKRNDQITIEQIKQLAPSHIIISPGPCDPNQSGISLEVIDTFKGKIPILGVCLGHQAIGQYFGGKIIRADQPVHGKSSLIYHANKSVFKGLDNPVSMVRYHSLIIDSKTLPNCLEVTAWIKNENKEQEYIMGIRHKTLAIEGVQFHPESVSSISGLVLLESFFNGAR